MLILFIEKLRPRKGEMMEAMVKHEPREENL